MSHLVLTMCNIMSIVMDELSMMLLVLVVSPTLPSSSCFLVEIKVSFIRLIETDGLPDGQTERRTDGKDKKALIKNANGH